MRARVRLSFLRLTISLAALFSLVQEEEGCCTCSKIDTIYHQSAAVPQACLEMKSEIIIKI